MQLDLDMLEECGWSWDENQRLLRDMPNIEDLALDARESVEIYGVPYVQGGGQCSFTLVWETAGPDEPILVETRDFWEDDTGDFPIWENARIVPTDDRFYRPVIDILGQINN